MMQGFLAHALQYSISKQDIMLLSSKHQVRWIKIVIYYKQSRYKKVGGNFHFR